MWKTKRHTVGCCAYGVLILREEPIGTLASHFANQSAICLSAGTVNKRQ